MSERALADAADAVETCFARSGVRGLWIDGGVLMGVTARVSWFFRRFNMDEVDLEASEGGRSETWAT